MSDVWGAISQAQSASQNSIDAWYHNQAQNALAKMYGPIAGNPQAALQMQQYNYLGQQDPQYVEQLKLENQLNAGMMPSRIQNNQGVANQNTAAGNVALGTQAPRIASDTASLAANTATAMPLAQAGASLAGSNATQAGIATAQMQGFQHMRAITAASTAAEQALNSGASPADAWETGKQAAIAAGADPNDPALGAKMQQSFVTAPQATIDQLRSTTLAAQNAQLATMTLQQRIEMQKGNLEFQQNRGKLIEGAQTNFEKARGVEDDFLAQQGPLGTMTAGIHAGQDALTNMDNLVSQLSTNGLGKAFTEYVPSSTITQLQEQAKQVSSALSLDQMSALKAQSGGSASGIRNTKEFEAAGEALANFDPKNMTAAQLEQQIANARKYLSTAAQVAESKVASMNAQYPNIVARRKALETDYNNAIGLTPGMVPGLSSDAQPSTGAGSANPAPASSPAAPPSASGSAEAGSDWQKVAVSVGITPAQIATMSSSEVQQFKQLAASQRGTTAPGATGNGQDALDATTKGYARDVPASGGGASPMAQAIWGQESGNKGNPTSIDGAIGPGQVMPSTFAAYARPGEKINNPADNRAVSARILADYAQRYGGDPARIATAYFSGPGNVAPAGSPTPWLRDARDGNGKSVSGYVSDVMGRLHGAPITAAAPMPGGPDRPTPGAISTPSAVPTAQAAQPGADVLGAQPSGAPQRPSAPTDANRAGTGTAGAPANIGPVGSIDMTGQNAALASRIAAAQARQQLSKAPEQVMAGRALLAKYLAPDRRTA
jgi:hypothetical protein